MVDPNTLARLRLTLVPGLGPLTQQWLVQRFGCAADAWCRYREIARLAPAVATALARGPDAAMLERCLRWAEAPGHRLLAAEAAEYPVPLRETHGPPGILYAVGEPRLLKRDCVAIVGARNATPQGLRDAQGMAQALSHAGLTIVSGLALGIDAAAHRGGLEGAASSVAVLGTGIDLCYPRRNRDLRDRLQAKGCIVTEFTPGTPPVSGNFPRRNRIISGLARAVLVVEANEKSGSLLTAECALQQDRDVLAMPGSIHSPLSKGCHRLIKEGAALVETADDVLEALGLARRANPPEASPAHAPNEDMMLRALGRAPMSAEQIALRTGLAAATVAARLSCMQIAGQIEDLGGGRFQRVERPR